MSTSPIQYRLIKKEKHTGARLGEIITPHGTFPTPLFMPVGTQATVKTLEPSEVAATGADILLGVQGPNVATIAGAAPGAWIVAGLNPFGERARVGRGGLGQHHRGVRGHVAVGGVSRRLDRDGVEI